MHVLIRRFSMCCRVFPLYYISIPFYCHYISISHNISILHIVIENRISNADRIKFIPIGIRKCCAKCCEEFNCGSIVQNIARLSAGVPCKVFVRNKLYKFFASELYKLYKFMRLCVNQ